MVFNFSVISETSLLCVSANIRNVEFFCVAMAGDLQQLQEHLGVVLHVGKSAGLHRTLFVRGTMLCVGSASLTVLSFCRS